MQLAILEYDNNIEELKQTLSKNTNVDINETIGLAKRTTLMMAVSHGHSEIVDILLANNANIYLIDVDGNNVLHMVVNKLNKAKDTQEKVKLYKIILMLLEKENEYLLKSQNSNQYTQVSLEDMKNNGGFLPKDFLRSNQAAYQEFEKFISDNSISRRMNKTRCRSQSANEEHNNEEKSNTRLQSVSLPTALSSSALTTGASTSLSTLRPRTNNPQSMLGQKLPEERRPLLSRDTNTDQEVEASDETSAATFKIKIP